MFGKKKDGAKAKKEKPAKGKKTKKAKKAKSTEGQSRFGDGGIKALLANNIEKVLLAAMAVAAILIAFNSYKAKGLASDKQPTQLEQKIRSAESHIKAATWSTTSAARLVAPDNFADIASADVAAVNPGLYALNQPFEPCLLYTSPSPRDKRQSRMPSSA